MVALSSLNLTTAIRCLLRMELIGYKGLLHMMHCACA